MIEIVRLIADFGLVVLIWIVQLVIYPSFLFYQKEDLLKWHRQYTQKITFVVAPLMFTQTGIIAFQSFNNFNSITFASGVICASLWLLTFFEAVPLHHKIDQAVDKENTCKKLVQVNKKRTTLWTVLFLINLFDILN